jgi:hypothetical protein
VALQRSRAGLWDRARRRVEQLELPEPFDAEAFIALLARERGRSIDLMPVADLPDLPCGLVVTTRDSDWIVYRADTTRLHRQHILLHEAAHILCGHSERGGDGTSMIAAARTLMPHLSAELVRGVLGRTAYTEPDEREAELVASLILHRVRQRARQAGGDAGSPSSLAPLFGISEG